MCKGSSHKLLLILLVTSTRISIVKLETRSGPLAAYACPANDEVENEVQLRTL
eukprot:jgi/Psemu1/305792/fgenesh1_kg.219_\